MLKGSKVNLRPVRRADIANFLVWFNDPEVTQYLTLYLPMTEMAEEKWVEGLVMDPSRVNLVIEAADSAAPKAIGSIGFHFIENRERQSTFGIAIGDKEYWSRGYGSQAAQLFIRYGFEQLNLNRIASDVYDFNLRSQRLHLKMGFKEEGRRRQAKWVNGSYHDVVEYGLLRAEWNAQPGQKGAANGD
jgi:RimJ/RimL family protein N-acetyltransferase